MIRFPNRFAGMIPSRTHRTTVAAETSSSFATCFVVMYLFVMSVMLNLSAIYTGGESGAPSAPLDSVAPRVKAGGGGQDVSTSENVSILFPFRGQC
jgi:hypothetical protein